MKDLKLMILRPYAVMTALVNQDSFTYPLDQVTMDNVSTVFDEGGDHAFVQPEFTVLFGVGFGDDSYGRQRIRKHPTAGTLYIGRSPAGFRDGEVMLQDDAFITVYGNDLRVWSQVPYIDWSTDPPTIYKDSELAADTNVELPPPIANAGAWTAGTVDADTGYLRVTLPHETNTSFAVAAGAGIASYTWEMPVNAVLVSGTLNDSQITVDQPPGLGIYRLTVEDDEGHAHSAMVCVYAYDPDDETSASYFVRNFQITRHEHTPAGQQLSIKITQALDEAEYPDGTIVMLWRGEPSSPTDRGHMEFVGWHQSDPARIVSTREGVVRETTLHCTDVAGRLSIIHGFPLTVMRNDDLGGWYTMPDANMLQLFHYILNWHSNALIVADFKPPVALLEGYPFVAMTSDGDTVYRQVQEKALAIVPDHHFTCNRIGQLMIVPDPLIQAPADRTATVQAALDEGDWTSVEYEKQHWPRYHWVREEAVMAHATNLTPLFSIAPGASPGQGTDAAPHGQQLALSQADLNSSAGQRYARLNSAFGPFTIRLAGPERRGIDPAYMEWIMLDLPAEFAAHRGLALSGARLLPQAIRFDYRHTREAVTRGVTVVAELETAGVDGEADTSRAVEE